MYDNWPNPLMVSGLLLIVVRKVELHEVHVCSISMYGELE